MLERERDLERRSVRRLRALAAVLGVAALIAGALTVFAVTQARRAGDQAQIATARELAAAAASLDTDPERSILLAREAVRRTRAPDGSVQPEVASVLHHAVGASRLQLAVPDIGGYVDWSPTGNLFVTEGPEEEGVIDLRDAETGASVRRWIGHDVDINSTPTAGSTCGTPTATSGCGRSTRHRVGATCCTSATATRGCRAPPATSCGSGKPRPASPSRDSRWTRRPQAGISVRTLY